MRPLTAALLLLPFLLGGCAQQPSSESPSAAQAPAKTYRIEAVLTRGHQQSQEHLLEPALHRAMQAKGYVALPPQQQADLLLRYSAELRNKTLKKVVLKQDAHGNLYEELVAVPEQVGELMLNIEDTRDNQGVFSVQLRNDIKPSAQDTQSRYNGFAERILRGFPEYRSQ
ncbi:protein of unknown function [Atopomonas hussainii]|uniref:DUF4136 domain-containing protein n=1 Tax=Atopomonas hussainii TaxID=1429083 RepID=A0A1H7S031_9GAMM|nr:DUF4136 domain-containing protein [Atopomonas hussainii]SEL65639.1 protein of unknown function [Atopomonas hussainii]